MESNPLHSPNHQLVVLFIERSRCLQLGDHACYLTPKASLLLRYFIQHPNRDLTKRAIQKAVWPSHHVAEGGIKQLIKILRTRLAWVAPERTFIVAVRGVGYRFVGQVRLCTAQRTSRGTRPAIEQMASRPPVGQIVMAHRRRELTELEHYRRRALSGTRDTVLISGGAGTGKTTLLQNFLADITKPTMHRVAAASCIDHTGKSTPFLPFLNALWHLCYSDPEGHRLMQLLPFIASYRNRQVQRSEEQIAHREAGSSPLPTEQRLMQEITVFTEKVSLERGLILWLDDLRHVDESSMKLFCHLARRREPARLLLIGTHRPLRQYQSRQSFSHLVTSLLAQGHATSLLLTPYRDDLGREEETS